MWMQRYVSHLLLVWIVYAYENCFAIAFFLNHPLASLSYIMSNWISPENTVHSWIMESKPHFVCVILSYNCVVYMVYAKLEPYWLYISENTETCSNWWKTSKCNFWCAKQDIDSFTNEGFHFIGSLFSKTFDIQTSCYILLCLFMQHLDCLALFSVHAYLLTACLP